MTVGRHRLFVVERHDQLECAVRILAALRDAPEVVADRADNVLRVTLAAWHRREHERADLTGKLAHRWPGFADATMHEMLAAAGPNAT